MSESGHGGTGPDRDPDEPVAGTSTAGAPAGDPAADPRTRPAGAADQEAAGEPARMADIQRERAAEEHEAGEDAARGGANRSVVGRDAERPAVKTRWRLREVASDLGARDRLGRMFDRGRRRTADESAEQARATGPAGRGLAPVTEGAPARRDRRRGVRRADDGSRETSMVPRAEFRSYYGRPVLKPPVWNDDIAYYFFLGGLSAGSSLLGAGADLTGRPALRRGTRIGALVSLVGGSYFLVHDLGRPERLHHMLRVAKLTSPMSVGTWVLAAYGLPMGIAGVAEMIPPALRGTLPDRLLQLVARPAGLAAAGLAPAVASYTAVLLSQTAVPTWHEAHEELPFVFTASAAASAGGLGMLAAPPWETGPARALAVYGAVVELAASRRAEHRLGLLAEPMHIGKARRYLRLAQVLTAGGAVAGAVLGRRSRVAAVASGAALMAGGLFERLGLLHAGIESTKDPKYVVGMQRERIERDGRTRVLD